MQRADGGNDVGEVMLEWCFFKNGVTAINKVRLKDFPRLIDYSSQPLSMIVGDKTRWWNEDYWFRHEQNYSESSTASVTNPWVLIGKVKRLSQRISK